jgi:DNA primase
LRYPPQILDEIRARLPVSVVVGRKVRLKKAGREWKGLSPFNAEKTPSFYVNDQKGFYHCFSSGKHGDIFTFLMETEGLSFPEAVERLAGEAGVPLPKLTREDKAEETRRKSLYDVMEIAAQFFESALFGRFGAKARDYLASRGLDRGAQEQFRIGYAPPERFALRDHLAAKDVPAEMMIEAGLLVAGEDIRVPYDRFRDRIMFPICDLRGRVIAFGGRAMSAEVAAKYLNSPDTPLFSKGRLLYNHHQARAAAHDRGTVVVVEGYVDVIALAQAGFPNAVAPLGTALTEDQLGLLWRMCDEPVLCFDGDKAGRRAAYRALETALPQLSAGKSLRFALLPEGQDPDDLARSGGAGAIERVITGSRPLVDILWARETEAGPLDTPERRAALERRLKEALSLIRDETLRRYYRDDVEARLCNLNPNGPSYRRLPPGRGRPAMFGRKPERGHARNVPITFSPRLTTTRLFSGAAGISPREAFILVMLASRPRLLEGAHDRLALLDLTHPDTLAVASQLLDELNHAAEENRPVQSVMTPEIERLRDCVPVSNRRYLTDPDLENKAGLLLQQALSRHEREVSLRRELAAAQAEFGHSFRDELSNLVADINVEVNSLDGSEADERGTAEQERPMDAFLDKVLGDISRRR